VRAAFCLPNGAALCARTVISTTCHIIERLPR
jgi:hypothetical protein